MSMAEVAAKTSTAPDKSVDELESDVLVVKKPLVPSARRPLLV